MATTSTIKYCTTTDLFETYPGLEGFDSKVRIYGWQTTDTSNLYIAYNTGTIDQLFINGEECTAVADTPNANNEYNYTASTDSVQFFNSSKNPSDYIMETGADWETLQASTIKKASRMVESLLDSRLSREIMKDREGIYPEFIVRATALKTIVLLMKAHDPENPILESFESEFKEIIEGYRSGGIQLPNSVTADSAKGVIRTVSIDNATDLFPVELKGSYTWEGYDLIKLKISTAGVIGTAKYSVWVKNQDGLKQHKVVDDDLITGDFDVVSNNLYVRFAGDDDSAAVVLNDEWEIEVHGHDCATTISQGGSVRLSRRSS